MAPEARCSRDRAQAASFGEEATGYHLKGELLEVCDRDALCPCWIGEDPDNGTCQSSLVYRIERGEIDGVDVSGLNFGTAVFIPGRASTAAARPAWSCRASTSRSS